MLVRVDPSSEVPLFEQLSTSIRAAAIDGSLAAGERLPSARELAHSLDVNLHTVLRAYQTLRDEGLIELRPGRGATVTQRVTDYAGLTQAVSSVVAEARAVGLSRSALLAIIREAYQ